VTRDICWLEIAASLVLVVFTIGLGLWLQLGITRRIVVASGRAAVQLIAVGYLIRFIVDADDATAFAWIWVVAMVVVTAIVARRRTPELNDIFQIALVAIGVATGVCLAVIFGLGVLDLEPLTLVVIAGITIGNTLPSVVLAANRVAAALQDDRAQVEGLLALGFDATGVVRFFGGRIVRTALIPQIERTNVVGLIALPGAMTGLLLAGVDPLDAVLLQLVVMYLVLGSATASVVLTVVMTLRRSLTRDLRLDWIAPRSSGE
jgi:putative ABC transport system permease protein